VKVGIGQDSHRFVNEGQAGDGGGCGCAPLAANGKPLVLGGVVIPGAPALEGNSDADAVLHALCNAISGVTGVNVLGEVADRMLAERGETDSEAYVREALRSLAPGERVVHASFSIECLRPKLAPHIPAMRENIARVLGLPIGGVGVTATTGEGLTAFGQGLGVQALCVVTVTKGDVPSCHDEDGARGESTTPALRATPPQEGN